VGLAPKTALVQLGIEADELPMRPGTRRWWYAEVPDVKPDTDYAYLLGDGDQLLPDPRSLWQPHGVHGFSRVYDHSAFVWSDQSWTGRQLPGAVLYELHVGTFTPTGTVAA